MNTVIRKGTRFVIFGGASLALTFVALNASTAELPEKPALTGYYDTAAGRSLVAGRYDLVIQRLGSRGAEFSLDQVAASTNLCIAEIETHRWDAARATCDSAVTYASLPACERARQQRAVAIAYSNRAVLRWLQHEPEGAVADLAKARAIAPGVEVVEQNFKVLATHPQPGASVVAARQ
jgi:hypothetical protein